MLRERVWPYSPDLVVLAFYVGNDVSDNSPSLGQSRQRPFFVRGGEGTWVIDNSFRQQRHYRKAVERQKSLGGWIRDRVRFVQLIEKVLRIARTRALQPRNNEDNTSRFNVYEPPTSPQAQDAWKATEYLVDTMNNEVKDHHALFLLVTLGTPQQVYPDPAVRDGFARKLAISDLLYSNHRLESFAASRGIQILSLAEPFERYADAHKVFLHGFNSELGRGHWNREGHRLAGNMMASRICKMLLSAGSKAEYPGLGAARRNSAGGPWNLSARSLQARAALSVQATAP